MLNEDEKNMEVPKILNLDDDENLIKSFNKGDIQSFKRLMSKHKEKVRNLIYITIGNAGSVDDIAQEVFINVYRNLNRFRFDSQFTTWLYRITINKCKDHLRKTKLRNIFLPFSNDDEEIHPSAELEMTSDISEIVQRNINKLPEKLRLPLLMKEVQGLSYQEISESIGCELGTVKSRIFRARENLKVYLKPYEKELRNE